ncbi:MAG TPA: NADH-quinone oxidoreductase subunit C [Alphaproteobacteria bacterium]|nr:NADH-quinone oxidoreductase subunit C [Alphaproteobacteria bacterium]
MDITALRELGEQIESALPQAVSATAIAHGELTVHTDSAHLPALLAFLRNDPNCRFSQLIDITAADYPGRAARFDLIYHLLSVHQNQRVRVKLPIAENAAAPSMIALFPNANWYEREVFDMFGIAFTGHPDLRRLLTDYGFEGHPLRKDFPLTGFVQVRYDDERKRVVNEPVMLTQEFRSFDFVSPWEGGEYVLPGDEKATPIVTRTGVKP